MTLKPRPERFVRLITDPFSQETFGNGTKSAEKAGYRPSNAAWQSTQLLKNPQVIQRIEELRKEQSTRYQKSKEDAILEARQNYDHAETPAMKKFWWEQWTALQGWQVQKTESKNSTEITEKQNQTIADLVRQQMQGVN